MYKQISSLLLTASMIFSVNATNNSFSGLTPSIEASADKWIAEFVSKLDISKQLMYLNLFIQPSSSSVEAAMKCIQQIQADSSLAKVSEQLEQNMQKLIELYITHMQKKFESLKRTSPQAVQGFLQKLEKKIYELIAHFYGIYYTRLYKHIEKQDSSVLCYMFDEQGIIAPEKRVRTLPKPTA
jgi:hypothetical protein